MNGNELRQKYLDFMAKQGHTIVPSASLVPENDPTTLFTGSGMQPMLPYLLGETHPSGSRVVDSQRCFRVQDIEEVGDNRHTTVFEMLGNWSLGDYFKKEQLHWMWEFLTNEVGLNPAKLYVTVFAGSDGIDRDDEAIEIWTDLFSKAGISATVVDSSEEKGMQDGRIFTYGAKKNIWSRVGGNLKAIPAGEPCGPDSEIFYEFEDVKHDAAFGEQCHVNCDCGRYLEIGNNVFMQYQKQTDGSFKPLPQKNIDFGGGLERVLAAENDVSDVFKTDLFWPIISRISDISAQAYEGENIQAFRIITDHLKAATWLLSDGVIPSNKAQGYVLRRLIRRAVRFGRALGIERPFTSEVVGAVQAMYGDVYPHVNEAYVQISIVEEEEKFLKTLDRGLIELRKRTERQHYAEVQPELTNVALEAFDLYQTFGLPVDIYIDELMSKFPNLFTVEQRQEIEHHYQTHFLKHQAESRQGSVGMFKGGLGGHSGKEIQYHTVTHLLQQALRDVLGDTVIQRGSNITPERLRFDFTSENRLTAEQKAEVETIVNDKITAELPVSFTILPMAEAEKSGAIHAFGEKYGEAVKVYSIGPLSDEVVKDIEYVDGEDQQVALETKVLMPRDEVYSREFCGGPHVRNTSIIKGKFRIVKDEKIARDVVRIKAVLE